MATINSSLCADFIVKHFVFLMVNVLVIQHIHNSNQLIQHKNIAK